MDGGFREEMKLRATIREYARLKTSKWWEITKVAAMLAGFILAVFSILALISGIALFPFWLANYVSTSIFAGADPTTQGLAWYGTFGICLLVLTALSFGHVWGEDWQEAVKRASGE